jgi:capsular exopolysaccharide synthesis family protein
LLEYLDDTLKTPEEVSGIVGKPILGLLSEESNLKVEKDKEGLQAMPYVARQPRSQVAESFRNLRTNLEFSAVDKSFKTILVTSFYPQEGKSTIASNLAITMAHGNNKVVLIDCDLHRPGVHKMFGLINRQGLSGYFLDQVTVEQLATARTENLSVITSGSLPPNPAELLRSEKMTDLLDQLGRSADIVILDSPPLQVTDSLVLAARADLVLLVLQPGRVHAGDARAIVEQLDRAGANVAGIMVNRIPQRRHGYYGKYGYYYGAYSDYAYAPNK